MERTAETEQMAAHPALERSVSPPEGLVAQKTPTTTTKLSPEAAATLADLVEYGNTLRMRELTEALMAHLRRHQGTTLRLPVQARELQRSIFSDARTLAVGVVVQFLPALNTTAALLHIPKDQD